MQQWNLDTYSPRETIMHRLPAMAKLVGAVGLVVAVSLWPRHWGWYLLIPTGLLLLVTVLGRVSMRFLCWRLLTLEPLVLGVAVLALFQPVGEGVGGGGWRLAGFLMARCTLCLVTMILLSNVTPFSELLLVFRRLRVPALLVTTLALMYRYLFVLVDEAQRMKRARQSRSFAATPARRAGPAVRLRHSLGSWRTLATVVSQLFVRASERAERIYAAMCARGWDADGGGVGGGGNAGTGRVP